MLTNCNLSIEDALASLDVSLSGVLIMKIDIAAAVASSAIGLLSGTAFAATVPATYAVTSASTTLSENGFLEDDTTIYGTSSDPTAVPGTVSATTASKRSSGDGKVVLSQGPTLTAHGFAGAQMAPPTSPSDPIVSGQNRGVGTAKAIFWMAVDGPAAGAATVPVRVISNGLFQVSGGLYTGDRGAASFAMASGSLTAQWYDGTGFINGAVHQPVESPNRPLVDESASVTYTAGDIGGKKTASINLNQVYDFSNKSLYEITMSISAGAQIVYDIQSAITNSGNLYADALLDPLFELDPAYAKLGYTLTFSDDISGGVVSAVPLPASAPLFGASLIALGALGYRVRRTKAAAA